MKGQLKVEVSDDLKKVVPGLEYKGDMPTGSSTWKVGKSSSIRVGDMVELPGCSPVDVLGELP